MPRYAFTLAAGDALYNPPWRWHQVRNDEGFTVGCATRELRFWATLRNSPRMTLLQDFTETNARFSARVTRRPVERLLRALPFFVLGYGLKQELLRGYVDPPLRAYGTSTSTRRRASREHHRGVKAVKRPPDRARPAFADSRALLG